MSTKTTTTTTATVSPAPTFEVCKNGRKYDLVENGTVIESFRTKREAIAELEACKTDASPAEVIQPEPVAEVAPALDVAALSPTERIKLAKAEVAARKADKSAPTPVLDWMADPRSVEVRARKARKSTGTRGLVLTDEQETEVMSVVVEFRATGLGWHKVADALAENTAVRRPDGQPFEHHQLYAIAKRRGQLHDLGTDG